MARYRYLSCVILTAMLLQATVPCLAQSAAADNMRGTKPLPANSSNPTGGQSIPSGDQTLEPSWDSSENEIKIGTAYAQQLEASVKLLSDPVANDYVNGISQKLATACDVSFPIKLRIIDSENINAIALPGGFLYLTSGLISATEDEAELAGAVAHLMGHICLHQFIRGMTPEKFKVVTQPVPVPIDKVGFPGFSIPLPPLSLIQTFPPELETDADKFALQSMEKAGYDPRALVTVFTRIGAIEKERPGSVEITFYSHLQTPSRLRKAKAHAKTIHPGDAYIVNSSEFDTAQARLLAISSRYPRPFSILLATHHATVRADSHVEIQMTLMNTSRHRVSFNADGLFPYKIDVRNSAGSMAPDTEAGLKLKEMQGNGVIVQTYSASVFLVGQHTNVWGPYVVKPGEKITTQCVVNDYYDLSKPGKYFIQVERRRSLDYPAIRSNTLTITVLAATRPVSKREK